VRTKGESSAHLLIVVYLWRKGEVRRPPVVIARLFLVTDQSLFVAAEVEARRAVTYRPASRPVWMTLDGEPLGIGELVAAARRVAPPVAGQVASEVAADVDRVVLGGMVLDDPELFLAQRRAGRVDLEAERLGGEVAPAAVK